MNAMLPAPAAVPVATAMPTKASWRRPVLQIAVFLVVLIGLGVGVHGSLREKLVEAEGSTLLLVAQHMAESIGASLAERAQHAEMLAERNSTRRLVTGAATPQEAKLARSELESTARIYRYHRLVLLNRTLDVVLANAPDSRLSVQAQASIRRAIESGRPVLTEFYFEDEQTKSRVLFGVVHPVFAQPGSSDAAVGAIFLERDAAIFIFPTIMRWPTRSLTTSAALIARSGNELVVVNPTRAEVAALALRLPADNMQLLSTRVVRTPGIARAKDYLGVPVIGAGVTVPGTDLVVVTKMDISEAEEPLHALAAVIIALGLAFALGAGWVLRNQLLLQRQRAAVDQAKLTERFAWLTRYANDMIFLTDDSGAIVELNECVESSYGYSREELLHMNAADLRVPDKRLEVAQRRAELASGESVLYRTEHMRKDGSRLPVEISMRAIDRGGVRYVLAVVRDISQLVERERYYNAAIDSAIDGFVVFDRGGAVLEANQAVADLFGYSVAEMRGMHTSEFVLHAPPFETMVDEIRAAHSLRYDVRCRRKDGAVILVEASSTYVEVGAGAVLAFLRDVTAKREEEAKAQRTARLYAFRTALSEMLLREHDLVQLLEGGCRIAVENGGLLMAWGGLVDHETRAVRPVAQAGASHGYVEQVRISLGDDERARGPTGTALREGKNAISNDIANDPAMAPWRAAALERGYRACAAFPIRLNGAPCAVISLYAEVPGYFGEFELHLLDAMCLDISIALELNQAQTALRLSEAHLLQAQAVGGIGSWTFDVATAEVSGSAEAQRIFGLGPGAVKVETLLACAHPDDIVPVQTAWRAALAGAPYEAEYRLIVNDEVRWINSRGVAQKGADGQIARLVGVVQDVTERHRVTAELAAYRMHLEELVAERTRSLELASERLRAAGAEQRAVFETAPVGIVLLRQHTILNCNARTDEMFGYARGEQIGQSTRLWAADDAAHEDVTRELAETLAAAGAQRRELQLVRKDGSRFWARLTGRALDADAPAKGMVGIIEDITQERAATEVLQQARQSAEEASQAKSAFLANMSHEIRTPMNAIIGFAHLLRRDPLTLRQVEQLDKMTMAAKHLLQVINDILDVSKIEAGKMTIETADFDVHQVLENVRSLVQEQARAKDLALTITLHKDGLPAMLRGDGMRLGQILLNLVGNAVKFTAHGGIRIDARLAAAGDDDIRLRFEVADTGIGLSAEQQQRLFQPFEQADVSTTRRYGGTGLGLVICKRLVEMMDGHIGVVSEPGKGACFWFEVRLGRSAAVPLPVTALATLKGMRALVVDDDAAAREILATMLSDMGLRASVVASAEQALEALIQADHAGDAYRLLLVDWKMPGMDGVDLALRVQSLQLVQRPEFLLATAYGNLLSQDEALRAGIQRVLTKPVSPSDLQAALVELLARLQVSAGAGSALAEQVLARHAGARLLVVEDNPINQDVASSLFTGVGLAVDIAENGQVAIDKVRTGHYDLILMDVQMPVMDGLEATVAIRKLPGLQNVPILAMTANVFGEDRARCTAAGMDDHVAKPVDPDALFATVAKWLAASKAPAAQADQMPALPPDTAASRAAPVAATLDNAALRARLAAIDGLDVQAGLRPVRGALDRYVQLLERFADDHCADAAVLAGQIDAGERAAAQHTAHTLKGVASTLGVLRVQALAMQLEQGLKGEVELQTLGAQVPALAAALRAITGALKAALPVAAAEPEPAAVVAAGDWAQVAAAFDRLEPLLAQDDAAVGAAYEQCRPLLQKTLGAAADTIGRPIAKFDLAVALEALRDLRDTRPELRRR